MGPIKIKRLWKGKYASIRNYDAERAIRENKPLVVILEGYNEQMTLTPEDLLNKKAINTPEEIRSRINPDQMYSLWDYEWSKDDEVV